MGLVDYQFVLKSSPEKRTVEAWSPIDRLTIPEQQVLHGFAEVCSNGFHSEMKVIWHKRVCVHDNAISLDYLAKQIEEQRAGVIVPEHLLMACTAIHNVVARTGIIDSQGARHS